MSTNRLYDTWFEQIRQLRPLERITRLRNLVWLIVGIWASKSVHLSKIAGHIPGPATQLSLTRRLERFLDNAAVRVREWYKPIAQSFLQSMAATVGEIRLIADGTKIGFHHQLLIVAVAYRRRAIPIVWTWIPSNRGHSSAHKQLALLAYVRGLLPGGVPVLLVGDSEFGAVEVMRQLEAWKWCYVLRQKANNQVKMGGQTWRHFGDLIHKSGQSIWLGQGLLTAKHAHPVNLWAHWQTGEDEPWLLATNLPSQHATRLAYRRRMWIEEMFGDLKGHGFDLESTHLIHFERLSRLTLAVALLYLWLIVTGTQTIQNGLRRLVDRAERRDLSIFQIGLRLITRRLTNVQPISICLSLAHGCKLSGG
jgi:hypothetical protein